MDNPEYIQIEDKKYKINADYRNVLEFNRLYKDENISDYEKLLSTICMFYGKDAIEDEENYNQLLEGVKKIIDGRPNSINKAYIEERKQDMDYDKDMNLIISSMWSEYGIDITKEKIHWWTFFDLLNGLSSECALNRVREIRTKDISKIQDKDERNTYIKLKQMWNLDAKKENELTEEQIRSRDEFYKNLNL